MPSQLKQRIPWFSFCENVFTAYDPPHTLAIAKAWIPHPTPTRDMKAQPLTPVPSATLDPGARKTIFDAGSVPSVTHIGAVERKTTTDSLPQTKLASPDPGSNDLRKGSDAKQSGIFEQGSGSKQSSDISGDPRKPDNAKEDNDPKQGEGGIDDPGEGSGHTHSSSSIGDPTQGNNAKTISDPEQTSGNSLRSSQTRIQNKVVLPVRILVGK